MRDERRVRGRDRDDAVAPEEGGKEERAEEIPIPEDHMVRDFDPPNEGPEGGKRAGRSYTRGAATPGAIFSPTGVAPVGLRRRG